MTDTPRARKLIAALLAKTVARGATPGEEAAARAKAEQLALKYGLPLHDPWADGARRYGFNPRPRPAAAVRKADIRAEREKPGLAQQPAWRDCSPI